MLVFFGCADLSLIVWSIAGTWARVRISRVENLPCREGNSLCHCSLVKAAPQPSRLSRSLNHFIDSNSISVPFHLRGFIDPIYWGIWGRGRAEAWPVVGLRISGLCGVVRLLRHVQSFVLISLGRDREDRARGCFLVCCVKGSRYVIRRRGGIEKDRGTRS